MRTLPLLVVAFVLGLATLVRGEDRVLFDFEQGNVDTAWITHGKLEARRAAVLEPPAGEGKPAGSALEIQAPASSGFASEKGQVPRDWRGFAEFSCWVYRSPAEVKRAPKVTAELRLLEEDGATRFWRKIELTEAGWSKVAVPLKWFRPGEGRIARWDRVERLQFWFRDEAQVQIDRVAVTTGDEQSAQLSEKDLRDLAFPGVDPQSIQAAAPKEFLILTNAKDLEIQKLADQLTKVAAAVRTDFPFLGEHVAKPVLLIFATREEYQAFTPRLAERLGAQAAPPKSGGYTLNGIATSFWDPQQGTLRPVYTHEFVHSFMDRTALLPNRGEWLQEGLATRYQLKFHPQANLGAIVVKGLEDANLRLPIETLANGKPIPLDRYWQALSLVEFLLADADLKKQVPELFAQFLKTGNTELGPHLGKLIAADAEKFTAAWAAWCRKNYGEAKEAKKEAK